MKQERLRWLPATLCGIFGLYLLLGIWPPRNSSAFDMNAFGRLPVLNGGRMKPLDTVARSSLLMLSGKQTIRTKSGKKRAIEWLADVLFQPSQTINEPVFEIDDPDVLGLMGIFQTTRRRFSFAELASHGPDIEKQAQLASQVKPSERSRFQGAILNLAEKISLYHKLQNTVQWADAKHQVEALQAFDQHVASVIASHMKKPKAGSKELQRLKTELGLYQYLSQEAVFYPIPVRHGFGLQRDWVSVGQSVLEGMASSGLNTGVMSLAAMGDAYRAANPTLFNQSVKEFREWLFGQTPREISRTSYEWRFNGYEPFYKAMVMYVVVFLLIGLSWLCYPRTLVRSASLLLVMAFTVHTLGLVSRMILQGRPPVTNLYSSAIFVGWAAVLLGLILERLYRHGIGSLVSATIGFTTLIIAHHLAASGDTLEMMRAVLDSNFWLATHVITITIGYSSTFLAGFLAILYIGRQAFDPSWNERSATELNRMVYGVVCFSLLLSFVGTVLGGIWADQSWGRFWGWDPKENGALMIVLWNAFILHARMAGLAKQKALMQMAVFGNIVTACSWFGVNMLGIGLHSYGFMDKAFAWLMIFAASQLLIIIFSEYYSPKARRIT